MVFDTFVAANTAKGFFSYFDELLYGENAKKVYLIKGGPGCGKSTFMKKVAEHFGNKNYTVERILCSSDTGSLDGVKIIEKGIVIIDATPPHAFDMKFPGAFESIIDMSSFWDVSKLEPHLDKIKEISATISNEYRLVYNLLKAAGNSHMRKAMITETHIDNNKINKAIKKILHHYALIPTDNNAKITNRILSAFSPEGPVTLTDSFDKLCNEYVILKDSIGTGHVFMTKLATALSKSGYNTLRIHSPLLPESRILHIIIPEMKLGIVTYDDLFQPRLNQDKIVKIINSKSFISKEVYTENKNKINFEKKLTKELTEAVCKQLGKTKALHNKLEQFYIEASDYNKADEFTKMFINKI